MRLRTSDGRTHQVCGVCYNEGDFASDDEAAEKLPWENDCYCAGVYAGVFCDRHFAERYRTDLPNVVGGMSESEIEAYDYRDE